MIKRKIAMSGLYFLIFVFLFSGCATMGGRDSLSDGGDRRERELSVSSLLRFDDIPAPSGFNILDSESFAFQNDVTRVALLKYIGGKRADQVVWFYKEQMPLYNWNPINIIEYERRILNYEKEGESCIVTIESRGRKSVITIAISPKSRPMKVDVQK